MNKIITEESEEKLGQVYQVLNSIEVKGIQNMTNVVNSANAIRDILKQINTEESE